MSERLCSNCAKPSDGKTRCKRCMAWTIKSNKDKRDRRRAAGQCTRCGVHGSIRDLCDTCYTKVRDARQKPRLAAIAAYGGKCSCCGETQHEFLQIDHIHRDGAAERKAAKAAGLPGNIFQRLKVLNYPQDRFRCLCANCHNAISFYGYCPHKPNEKICIRRDPPVRSSDA